MKSRKFERLGSLLVIVLVSAQTHAQTPAALLYDSGAGPIRFAAADLNAALQQNGYAVTELPLGDPLSATQTVRVILTTEDVTVPGMPATTGLSSQGYAIQRVADGSATNWWVIGKDAPGVMYGGLEMAEAVGLADGLAGVTNRQNNPYIAIRGIKFNIPLDARSPSYSDDSDSAQANIANMWETNFWTTMFDNMARHRYNMISFWSLHPFPSLVRVPEYPNVALADVKKKSGALWNAGGTGVGMFNPSWTLTTLKTMTIEEKIAFWRWLMQYARDRGIDIYFMTWNIFVYGTEPSGYGITDSPANSITKDYFRKSVRAMFNTYPLLAGIGLTTGENMGGISDTEKEQWAWDTYGLGVSDAIADAQDPGSTNYAPNRVIRLIHRAHQANLDQIISYFQALPGYTNEDSTLTFSFKYSQAHMHSSIKPQFIYQNNWFSTIPAGKKTMLTVRNDDMYYLRWGGPDFARAYLTNFPELSKIAGFYMGPDGYTWGREYVSTEPESPPELVIEKMWYYFLLYGRLAYDPTIPNSRFEAILATRYPEVSSSSLFQGWASVSKILPLLTRFYWGALDFQWYPEACWNSSGFQTVQNFIDPIWNPMQSSEDGDRPLLMSIQQYVNGDSPNGRLNPEQVADLLQQYADDGLTSIQALSPGTNKELRLTLGDITAMGHLGRYYAAKIRGATELYRYQSTGLVSDYTSARTHLITASNHWSQYAAQWSTQYISQVLTRMGLTIVDIAGIQAYVNADIPSPVPPGTTNADVLFVVGDATALNTSDTAIRNRLEGYGYTVQVVSDTSAASINAVGKKLVLTSSTVASTDVGTKFRDVSVPVINWETSLQDDYGFAASFGNAASQTAVNITNPGHPLAAGFPSGIRTVATAPGDFSWGEPGGSSTIIARLNDGSNHPCLYAYETNAPLTSGPAPARRVHLFLQNDTFSSLNADALRLFDAALKWAMDVTSLTPPSASITQPTNGAVFAAGADVPLNASASDPDGTVVKVEYFTGSTTKIGESTTGPDYALLWTNAPNGNHQLTAVVTDDGGDTGTSPPISITVGTPAPQVLFVVGGPALNASDAGVQARLESFGLEVIVVDDDLCTTADADGKALVVTSSTVLSGKVGTKYQGVAVPVLNWEHYLQDDYLMTGAMQGVDWGSAVGQASLIVTNQGHPLAGGLADGVTSVASSDFEFPWGHPNPAAAVIAGTLNDGSGATCLYGYEVGAMLIDGSTPAPARRVQFFLTNDSFGQLNSAGLAMFDAAVGWAMDRAVPGWFQPPLLQGGLVRLEWVGGIEVQAAPAVTGVWATVPGVLSPMSLDPTNPAQFFRVKP